MSNANCLIDSYIDTYSSTFQVQVYSSIFKYSSTFNSHKVFKIIRSIFINYYQVHKICSVNSKNKQVGNRNKIIKIGP